MQSTKSSSTAISHSIPTRRPSNHLREDAQGTYDDEVADTGNDNITVDIFDWHASVIDKDAGCHWTWDLIEEEF